MKKLVLLITLVMTLGLVSVVGQQGIEIIVGDGPSGVTITPESVTFDSVIPGGTSTLDDAITFTVNEDSNQDLGISVLSVTEVFADNIGVSIASADNFGPLEDFTVDIDCQSDGVEPCTYDDVTLDAELFIPAGTPAGSHSGVITYLVTASTPEF